MNHLEVAQYIIASVPNAYYSDETDRAIQAASAYALISIAESLKALVDNFMGQQSASTVPEDTP